jgi:hypothetical protein
LFVWTVGNGMGTQTGFGSGVQRQLQEACRRCCHALWKQVREAALFPTEAAAFQFHNSIRSLLFRVAPNDMKYVISYLPEECITDHLLADGKPRGVGTATDQTGIHAAVVAPAAKLGHATAAAMCDGPATAAAGWDASGPATAAGATASHDTEMGDCGLIDDSDVGVEEAAAMPAAADWSNLVRAYCDGPK